MWQQFDFMQVRNEGVMNYRVLKVHVNAGRYFFWMSRRCSSVNQIFGNRKLSMKTRKCRLNRSSPQHKLKVLSSCSKPKLIFIAM